MDHISISIPAYNDAEALPALVEDSFAVLSKISPSHSVFVINDGSKDNTSEVLAALAKKYPKLKYYEHPQNLGFGATIKEVFVLPESEWVFFIPGDGQIPPAELHKLYAAIKENKFILGRRVERNDPLGRKFNSFGYNSLISLMAGQRIHDVNSVALLKREILKDVRFVSRGAFIHAEIALNVLKKGVAIREIPIEHKPRAHGSASGNKWRVKVNTVLDLLRYLFS